MATSDQALDLSGLNCPVPVMRSKKTLMGMKSGEVLHVIATDPATVSDFASLMPVIKCTIVDQNQEGGKFNFWIKRN